MREGAVPAECAVGCLPECERVDELPTAGCGTGKEGWASGACGWERLLGAAEHGSDFAVVLVSDANQLHTHTHTHTDESESAV